VAILGYEQAAERFQVAMLYFRQARRLMQSVEARSLQVVTVTKVAMLGFLQLAAAQFCLPVARARTLM
jgi:hypothetical protein